MLFGTVHGGGGGRTHYMWSRDLKCVVFFSTIIIISKRLCRRFCVCMRFEFWSYPGLLVFSIGEKNTHKKCKTYTRIMQVSAVYACMKKISIFFSSHSTLRHLGIYNNILCIIYIPVGRPSLCPHGRRSAVYLQ